MPNTGTLTGLTPGTSYVVDTVHVDGWVNPSAVGSSATFTTDAAASGTPAYFTTNAATPTYFIDPANVPSGTTKIEVRQRIRFNSTPANNAVLWAQESLGFEFSILSDGTTRTTVEDAGGNKKLTDHVTQTSGAVAAVVPISGWTNIVGVFDFTAGANGQFTLTVDGTTHPAVDAASTAGTQEFQSNREMAVFGQTSGIDLLPGGTDCEYFEIYFNDVLHKRIDGGDGAATINVDGWKQGGDVTVTT